MSAARQTVDLLIVGSGPVGSAFARSVYERAPDTRIVMVEAGPKLTDRPGVHLKNIADDEARTRAQLLSQGPAAEEAIAAAAAADAVPLSARPGTFYLDRDGRGMPVAAMSSNVGGMGAHWTCASPRPAGWERIDFIPAADLDVALAAAERLMSVRQDAFPDSVEGRAILRALAGTYDEELPEGRKVQPMPLSCVIQPDGTRYWGGADVILGPLADGPVDGFELRAETLCRRLVVEGDRVAEAVLEHLPSGKRERVCARAFAVAADALRTPQLLYASGIRPRALGRYLNDHTQVIAGVKLDPPLVQPEEGVGSARRDAVDATVGVFWVPYATSHPFHGQVMHLDLSPIEIAPELESREHVVGLGWFVPKDIRAEDRVRFSDSEVDGYGMPRPRIEYELTARDRERVEAAVEDQERGAAALGEAVPGRGPTLLPAGSSLHYQGSVRMGERDDGTSVCDSYSRVWGVGNLFVGGNGVIPTATASNPTLTSVALAVRATDAIAEEL